MLFNDGKRIKEITDTLNKISAGDPEQRVSVLTHDDIGRLAEAVNKLTDGFKSEILRLRKENNQARAILNSMAEGVIALDKDARIVSVNPTVEKLFNISGKETEGKFFLEAVRNNDISEIIAVVLKKGELVSQELTLVWPVQKIFQINASPIFEKNITAGCLVVIHDITEIRRLEVVRRDFVANVSHELKTPLTSIKGFVETLLGGALEDKENSRQFLEIILNHANRLDSLINDLLDLSSMESRNIRLEKKEINLKGLTDKILSGFKAQLKKTTVEVKNELPQGLSVIADKDRMEQVLTNLIDNAIKFNKENGFIKIYSRDLNDKIKVIVEDSGIGIPGKDILRIFERFYRVDKARSRELGGTGLGLSIVKHIVELHGGNAGVESTEGLGSKFWFTLLK
ncbi:MAG: ATP-binding protein [Candidatus Omnitrophica bacterium]|nr:ATP-binding protein [Candidatus Omnitrophota bacterium]